ncbi:MAG TPA: AraC family transcriptional regulator [Kofleriaceae bacterium]|nr:AraC family transcriptional regulator [Kofleriaceae bacterium]
MADRRAELRELIARHAPADGTAPSVLPLLRFSRSERASTFTSGHTPALRLAVVAQGKKICRVDDREYHYDAETYFVFTGETEFTSSVIEASRERPYLAMSLQLPPEDIVRALLSLGEQAIAGGTPIDEPPAFAAPLCPAIVDALCRLIHTLDDPAERQVLAPLIITELVFRLLRSDAAVRVRQAAGRCADHARIDQAMAFMRANLQRRLSVAAVARHVAMSPSHFAHRFREVARTSPMNYLKHARLHAARLSMINDGVSPGEVATRVGYQSPAHFSRDFKTYFALPPATYVRQFRAAGDAGAPARSQDPARRSQAAATPAAPA